jgi:hypothetical protein
MKGLHDLFRQSVSFFGSLFFFEQDSFLQQVSVCFDCCGASNGCTVKKPTSKRYKKATPFMFAKLQFLLSKWNANYQKSFLVALEE